MQVLCLLKPAGANCVFIVVAVVVKCEIALELVCQCFITFLCELCFALRVQHTNFNTSMSPETNERRVFVVEVPECAKVALNCNKEVISKLCRKCFTDH